MKSRTEQGLIDMPITILAHISTSEHHTLLGAGMLGVGGGGRSYLRLDAQMNMSKAMTHAVRRGGATVRAATARDYAPPTKKKRLIDWRFPPAPPKLEGLVLTYR